MPLPLRGGRRRKEEEHQFVTISLLIYVLVDVFGSVVIGTLHSITFVFHDHIIEAMGQQQDTAV